MDPVKIKRFRYVMIGYGAVCIVFLFAFRYQPFMSSQLIGLLLLVPMIIGLLVYYFLQVRMDVERKVGMKLVLLGSISRMGYLVGIGLILASRLVPMNAKLVNALIDTGLIVCLLVIVASYMYQAGMRKWRAAQQEDADLPVGETSEDDTPEED